jgi:hypothetical protein
MNGLSETKGSRVWFHNVDWLSSRGLFGKKDVMPVRLQLFASSLCHGEALGFDRREDDKGYVFSVRNRNNANISWCASGCSENCAR